MLICALILDSFYYSPVRLSNDYQCVFGSDRTLKRNFLTGPLVWEVIGAQHANRHPPLYLSHPTTVEQAGGSVPTGYLFIG